MSRIWFNNFLLMHDLLWVAYFVSPKHLLNSDHLFGIMCNYCFGIWISQPPANNCHNWNWHELKSHMCWAECCWNSHNPINFHAFFSALSLSSHLDASKNYYISILMSHFFFFKLQLTLCHLELLWSNITFQYQVKKVS